MSAGPYQAKLPVAISDQRTVTKRVELRLRWLVVTGLLLAAVIASAQASLADYVLDSDGMSPCYHTGELMVVNKLAYAPVLGRSPQAGDIVVAVTPRADDPRHIGLKRIVAVGSDTVAIQGGAVYVNGQALDGPYRSGWDSDQATASIGAAGLVVPRGRMFLLGENPHVSIDSRTYGAVESELIVGQVLNPCDAH